MLFLALAILPVTRDFARFNPAALATRSASAGRKSFRMRAASLSGRGGGLYRTIAAVMPGHRFMMLGNGRGCRGFAMTRCRMLRLNHLCRNRYRPGTKHEDEENRQNPRPSCASLNHKSIFAHSRFVRL
jgi:hypothetical protein